MQEVSGSIPLTSTTDTNRDPKCQLRRSCLEVPIV